MDRKISVPFFDNAEVALWPYRDDEPTPVQQAALDRFLALTPVDRLAASRHVHAYYRDVHTSVGGEDWLDAQMGVPATPEDIWPNVYPKGLFFLPRSRPVTDCYIALEASCDWEEEHGLVMVWHMGDLLVKVAPFDDHPRNFGVPEDVVYHGSLPEFTTRRLP